MKVLPMPFEPIKLESIVRGVKTRERRPLTKDQCEKVQHVGIEVGDVIALQEPWAVPASFDAKASDRIRQELNVPVWFKHNFEAPKVNPRGSEVSFFKCGKYRAEHEMPIWAVRYFLKVNSVHIEALSNATHSSVLSEGILDYGTPMKPVFHFSVNGGAVGFESPIDAYHMLWSYLYSEPAYALGANPLTLMFDFELCDKPDWL